MTTFGWKKKTGAKISKVTAAAFENDAKDDNCLNDDVDWISMAPRRKATVSLEDAVGKSQRLKHEGTVLAQAERFWEAIKKWDEALQLTPNNDKLYEMKAQALLILEEVFPAVQMARKAVELNPRWWEAHQTLGRAQLSVGEVQLAVRTFSTAVHLNPSNEELWNEDFMWAVSILNQSSTKSQVEVSETSANTSVTITEIVDNVVPKEEKTIEQICVKTTETKHKTKMKSNMVTTVPANYVKMRK